MRDHTLNLAPLAITSSGHRNSQISSREALACASICSSVWFMIVIASSGQVAPQLPHPLHIAATPSTNPSSFFLIAPYGPPSLQVPHPVHLCSSTMLPAPSASMTPFD